MSQIVKVNRSQLPLYPSWFRKAAHPELESAGPSQYGLSDIGLYLHKRQAWDSGCNFELPLDIYTYLKGEGKLASCLTLRDGEELVKVDPTTYNAVFTNQSLVLWGSVIEGNDGFLHVPYVNNLTDSLCISWETLKSVVQNGGAFRKYKPAALFK